MLEASQLNVSDWQTNWRFSPLGEISKRFWQEKTIEILLC